MLAQAVLSWTLVQQHRAYNSNAFDLAFFDQIVWNTSQGRPFATSFVPYNFAGQHLEPVLLLFAAAYRVRADVEMLLLTQAAVVAWAAAPLYLAARRVLASRGAGVCVAAAYLLAPHLHGAALFDFHPEVLGPLFIFGAFALLVAGRPGWSVSAVLGTLLLKEDGALAALGFALLVWMAGARRQALALAVIALVYLGVVVGIVMPAIRGGPGDLQERYGYLGSDAPGIARGIVTQPRQVASHLLARGPRTGLAYLLATQALLPFATPAGLAAAPLLALNMLVTHPPQRNLTLHYPVLPFALLLVASVQGAATLARSRRLTGFWRWTRLPPSRRTLVLAAALLTTEALGWLFGSSLGPRRFDLQRTRQTPHTAVVDRALRLIPAGVAVSAQSGLAAHVSQRRDIYEFPRLENAEWVALDARGWRSSQADAAGYAGVRDQLPRLGFCRVFSEDGVSIYQRRAACE